MASATGLRSTCAMPGSVSINDEICELPSSVPTRSSSGNPLEGANVPEVTQSVKFFTSSTYYYFEVTSRRETRGRGSHALVPSSLIPRHYSITRCPTSSYARCGRQKNRYRPAGNCGTTKRY